MKNQVAKLSERGLKCTFVGEEQVDRKIKSAVLVGEYQLMYKSPEFFLCTAVAKDVQNKSVSE